VSPCDRMRTVLICHHDDPMNRRGLAAWLGSFTDLVGLVVIRENKKRLARRIRREIRRVGLLRFADVVAFRTYYRLFLGSNDQEWERNVMASSPRRTATPRQLPVSWKPPIRMPGLSRL